MKKMMLILSIFIIKIFCKKKEILEKLKGKKDKINEESKIPFVQKEIAKIVNKLNTTWKAVEYNRDYIPLLGAIREDPQVLPKKEFSSLNINLPDEYDLRTVYPKCESLKEIRDQANCGSCWAFGAVEAISDRICIYSNQTDQRRISAQNLITCCTTCGYGCDGGYPAEAWGYWRGYGLPTGGLYGDKNTCQPYFLPPCDHHVTGSYGPCPETVDTPDCKKDCKDGNDVDYKSDLIKAKSAYSVFGEENIRQEIYESGPVEASFDVYEDFLTFKSGIYHHVAGNYVGGHAIKILGWGVENSVKYWLCANSWNNEWGDNGFFKILRGNNECNIEEVVYAGIPKL